MADRKKARKVSIADDEPLRMKSILSKGIIVEEGEDDDGDVDLVYDDAHVPVPPDGGWGWVVCLASFLCNLTLDGIAYTFGVLLTPLVEEFDSDRGTVSWVGSLLCGMYMLSGPITGGLVNRFGNRPVCIAGSLLAWASISLSIFSVNVGMMMFLYGILAGFGLGLIYLPAVVVVGHYFESKRALATGIALCGSGVGTFLFAPLSSYLVDTYGWKTSNLIFAGFFGICFLAGLSMKPLEIEPADEKKIAGLSLELPDGSLDYSNRNVTYTGIPTVQTMPRISEDGDGAVEDEVEPPIPQERTEKPARYRTVSVNQDLPRSRKRTMSLMQDRIERNYSSAQLRALRPRMTPSMSTITMSMSTTSMKQSLSQQKLAKPFERKDIFFSGSLTNFDRDGEIVFKPNRISYLSIKDGAESYLSRSSLVNPELKDSETVSSVLKKMMDFSILKDVKFLLVSLCNLSAFLGFYIPFMYLPSLVQSKPDISESQAAMVLSVIGMSNTLGRILTGWIADRPWANALTISSASLVLSSVCVVLFPFVSSFALYIVLAVVFGLLVAAYISLTSVLLVDLVGIEKLTSSFGLVTMFRGGAAILGPPMGGMIFEATQSFVFPFILAGGLFLLAGILSFAADIKIRREVRNATAEKT